MTGKEVIFILFCLSISSTVIYFFALKNEKLLKYGKLLYWIMTMGIVFISSFFLSNILNHNFEYAYIFQNSNTEMNLFYLIASFFAGQEGSFLLWALFLSLIGIFLQPYASRHKYEALTMGFYSLIILFLMLLLVIKSPFEFVWEVNNSIFKPGEIPPNGSGMNPILENFWMTIHPPILFVGYAALSVPFVFSIAGLIKKEYNEWIKIALPWTLFGASVFGIGIVLGGFWAYETLGWGGFWGWDPVENASLLPWLTAVALIHTMKVQMNTGGLVKTNFVLAVSSFLLVIYSTFLTRSGILSATSVHSFQEPGADIYLILQLFLAIFLVIGLSVLLMRLKALPLKKMDFNFSSKELMLSFGAMTVLGIAVVVFMGTSWPIFQGWFGSAKSAVEISTYEKISFPFMFALLILSGLSMFMHWKSSNGKDVMKKNILPLILSFVSTMVTVLLDVREPRFILLAFAAFYAFYVNVIFGLKKLKKPGSLGSFVSHIGLALLMFGVIGQGLFTQNKLLSLVEGESGKALGYKITFLGKEQIETEKRDRQKYRFHLMFSKDGNAFSLFPVQSLNAANNYSMPVHIPSIKSSFLNDIYVAPTSVNIVNTLPTSYYKKGAAFPCPADSAMTFELLGFDKSSMTNASAGTLAFGAKFRVNYQDTSFIMSIPTQLDTLNNFIPIWMELPGMDLKVAFTDFIPNSESMSNSIAALSFSEDENPSYEIKDMLSINLFIKPLISLVWLGFLFINAGFLFPIRRSIKRI